LKSIRIPILSAIGLALFGCTPTPPLDRIVSAESPSALAYWRERNEDNLTPAQWEDFDAALREVQMKIKIDAAGKDSDGVESIVCAKIAGQTVRKVLQTGFELKLARLDAEGAQLVDFIHKNTAMKPGSTQTREELLDKVYTQVALLHAVDKDMEETSQKLDLLLQRPHTPHKPHEPPP
jgi:hypothetical protein